MPPCHVMHPDGSHALPLNTVNLEIRYPTEVPSLSGTRLTTLAVKKREGMACLPSEKGSA